MSVWVYGGYGVKRSQVSALHGETFHVSGTYFAPHTE